MKKDKNNLLILLLASIIVMIPLLFGPSSLGHDTVFHVANIDSLKLDLDSNFLPSKISSTIGNAFGYGTHLFYPMFPHLITAYLTKATSILHINTLSTTVIMYGIITFLSAIAMYYLSKKITKQNSLALLSSIIFLFMPYRLGDIVVRSAFNECFTFLFMPLVLLGLLYLIENDKRKFYLFFVTGCTGLLYSHLVITMYCAILFSPFIIIYHKEIFKKEKFIPLITACIVIILLSLPELLPMLEHKLSTEYMVYVKNYMTNIEYMNAFNNHLIDYVKILPDYSWDIPHYINYIVIIMILGRLFFFIKGKKKEKVEVFLWIFTFLAFFISLNIFPWKMVPEFLYFIQFPWRMETMLTISISLLAPLIIQNINHKKLQKGILIAVLILIPCTELFLIKKLTNDVYRIGEIVPNNGMGHSKEYLPKKTFDNEVYFEYRGHDIMLISGNAQIMEIENSNKKLKFELTTDSIETTIEFPKLYYLGYHLKTKDGKVLALEESENGFLQARIEGSGTYTLVYEGTTLNKMGNILGIMGLSGFCFLVLTTHKEHKKNHREEKSQ